MGAMEYEFLMRSAYDSGRDFEKGADADVYRAMELAERKINNSYWGESKEDNEYDFRSKFASVRNYVEVAIAAGMKKIQCNNQEIAELNSILSELNFSFYNKSRLDEIIGTVTNIFSSHGLKA